MNFSPILWISIVSLLHPVDNLSSSHPLKPTLSDSGMLFILLRHNLVWFLDWDYDLGFICWFGFSRFLGLSLDFLSKFAKMEFWGPLEFFYVVLNLIREGEGGGVVSNWIVDWFSFVSFVFLFCGILINLSNFLDRFLGKFIALILMFNHGNSWYSV